MNSDVVIFA